MTKVIKHITVDYDVAEVFWSQNSGRASSMINDYITSVVNAGVEENKPNQKEILETELKQKLSQLNKKRAEIEGIKSQIHSIEQNKEIEYNKLEGELRQEFMDLSPKDKSKLLEKVNDLIFSGDLSEDVLAIDYYVKSKLEKYKEVKNEN